MARQDEDQEEVEESQKEVEDHQEAEDAHKETEESHKEAEEAAKPGVRHAVRILKRTKQDSPEACGGKWSKSGGLLADVFQRINAHIFADTHIYVISLMSIQFVIS